MDHEKRKLKNRIIFWASIIVGLGLIIWLVVASSGTQNVISTTSALADHDQVFGKRDSKVVVIEYSDFQCPACAAYQPMVSQLKQEYGEQIAIAYRHFPLTSIHPHARAAAEASEAAALQGKFWEMHDKLFENQTTWSRANKPRDYFIQYAQELSLDMAKFEADLDSSAVSQAVQDDILSGNQASVNATPTFFINGQSITNPRNYDGFKGLISQALLGA